MVASPVKIESEVGGPCTIEHPWPDAGRDVSVMARGKRVRVSMFGGPTGKRFIRFETLAGESSGLVSGSLRDTKSSSATTAR